MQEPFLACDLICVKILKLENILKFIKRNHEIIFKLFGLT